MGEEGVGKHDAGDGGGGGGGGGCHWKVEMGHIRHIKPLIRKQITIYLVNTQ